MRLVWLGIGLAMICVTGVARAQMPDHATMHHGSMAMPDSTKSHPAHTKPAHPASRPARGTPKAKEPMSGMEGMDGMEGMAGMAGMHHEHMAMPALYGPYPMTREASGTSWQPDRSRHQGIHAMRGAWMLMLHGMADVVATDQGGPRGRDKVYSSNMLMGMATRSLGPGRLGLRSMLSAEPATIGKSGYPLLLQTGETADGVTRLIDRQHPHDLFMELAATYSVSRGNRSLFVYGGLPGEPALGPPAFMHRFSGMYIPEAPITHHWLDSSHITFGVLTAGATLGMARFEASAFRGREPNQDRYDIEHPELDSHSFRLSVNPNASWALQASYGRLHSPEQLEPQTNVDRVTASAIYATDLAKGHWESTIAWGQNHNRPGARLDAVTLESALQFDEKHTVMFRAERVEKDELFQEGDPRSSSAFHVGELSGGYRYDFWRSGNLSAGLGVLGTLSFVPEALADEYGGRTARSGLIFGHVELR